MSSIVQNTIENILGDGARGSKFEVQFAFTDGRDASSVGVLAKATNFPGKKHDIIDFKYKGRSIPLKGQVKYDQQWECTFYLTQDHSLKKAFENWIEALDQKHNYKQDTSEIKGLQIQHANSRSYTTTMYLYQKDFHGDQNTSKYTMHNVFPISVSEIAYSADAVGQIQEFTVIFAYSYFDLETLRTPNGNFIDQLSGKFTDYAKNIIDGTVNNVADAINGFISDSTGNSLAQLNASISGQIQDIVPDTDSFARQLAAGGLGSNELGAKSLDDLLEIGEKAIDNFSSNITSGISGIADDINDDISRAFNKIKSLF